MNIKKQIDAAIALLKSQGRSEEEINYFHVFAEGLASKSVALLAQNYSKLLELAHKGKSPESDVRHAAKFGTAIVMDVTDMEVCDIKVALTYTEAFKSTSASQVSIEEALQQSDDDQLDLFAGDDDEEEEETQGELDQATGSEPAEVEQKEETPAV